MANFASTADLEEKTVTFEEIAETFMPTLPKATRIPA